MSKRIRAELQHIANKIVDHTRKRDRLIALRDQVMEADRVRAESQAHEQRQADLREKAEATTISLAGHWCGVFGRLTLDHQVTRTRALDNERLPL